MHPRAIMLAACLLAFAAAAQEPASMAPLPWDDQQRITPADDTTPSILTTKPVAPAAPKPLEALPAPAPAPFARARPDPATPLPAPAVAPKPAAVPFGTGKANSYLPAKVPFGHASPAAPVIPEGPHGTVATPVENVDAVEVSEPAPATPVAPEADPAMQDPAEPTELTSPLFDGKDDIAASRKIVLRVLNKVTAQSTLFKSAPKETVKFGRLEITTVMCRNSAPDSQPDAAGLLDINEQLPGNAGRKPLFKGWMYASSPSIAALEHPIYDVTMVGCEVAVPTPKAAPKEEKKAPKKAKK